MENLKEKFNGLAVVTVTNWNNGKSDKNGENPVLLKGLAGTIPNRSILSGTLAKNQGFEAGNTYAIQIEERAEDPIYGRQFAFTPVEKIKAYELKETLSKFGALRIFDVETGLPLGGANFTPDGENQEQLNRNQAPKVTA